MAETFAQCAGSYDALAKIMKGSNNHATAEALSGHSNGAELVAIYTYSGIYTETTRDKRATRGERGKEGAETSAAALYELGGFEAISEQLKICSDLSGTQADLVQFIRSQTHLKP